MKRYYETDSRCAKVKKRKAISFNEMKCAHVGERFELLVERRDRRDSNKVSVDLDYGNKYLGQCLCGIP